MLVCDTSGLIAYFDTSDKHHADVASVVADSSGPFIISPYVLAELDYLIASRRGVAAELAVLSELAGGAWELASCDASEIVKATRIMAHA